MRGCFRGGVTALAAVALAACTSPSAPDPFGEPPEGTHQSALFGVIGAGVGGVSVTTLPNPEGIFVATVRVRLRARPNTTYIAQRAPELGRALGADGTCQRAQGLSPWSASDPPFGPSFVPMRVPNPGPIVTLTTNAAGEAGRDWEDQAATIRSGDRFDVQMRFVDDEVSPASELRSGCMTVVVR